MKRLASITVTILSAALLSSCGGRNTNNSQDNGENSDNAPYGLKDYVNKLPKVYADSVYRFNETIDGSDDEYDFYMFYFFPYKNGGYFAVSNHNQRVFYGDYSDYKTYNYKEGKFDTVKNILPVPALSELLDEDKCKEDDNVKQIITRLYNSNPQNYIKYDFIDGMAIKAHLEPREDEDQEWDALYYNDFLIDYDHQPTYKWNGTQFVKQ